MLVKSRKKTLMVQICQTPTIQVWEASKWNPTCQACTTLSAVLEVLVERLEPLRLSLEIAARHRALVLDVDFLLCLDLEGFQGLEALQRGLQDLKG
jgi:hypothetical protein